MVLLGSVSAGFDAAGLDEEREPQYHEQVGEQKEKGFFDWQISDGPARVVASAMVQIPWPIAVESASHK